jgi:hypothetical protein
MTLSEQDLKLFKKWLKGCLKSGPVTVTFIKKDGTERVMNCTTDPTVILFKDPTLHESKRPKAPSEDAQPVFDLKENAWRSFRWDSIKSVSITVGKEYEHTNSSQ